MEPDLRQDLMSRVLFCLIQSGVDIQPLKSRLTIIFDDYKIEPKETAMVVYTGGKNEHFVKQFLLAKAVAGRSKRTIEQYGAEISRFLERVGKDADQITAQDVQVYIAKLLTAGRTKSYCDTVRRYLNSFYGWLYREEKINTNPMNKVDAIKYKREKEQAFTDLELEQMRSACKTSHERAIFETLLSTGCRASELCSILIEDIRDNSISIQGKGGKWRTVYINAKAQVAILAYLREREDKNPYLFPAGVFSSGDSGLTIAKAKGEWFRHKELVDPDNAYGHESVNATVKRIAKRAGVEGSHAHRFRRTCATHALRHGMPIEQVSMLLGHEQISTTQIYLDIREEDLREAHKRYVT